MNFIKNNPRKTLIIGLYAGLFLVGGFFLGINTATLLLLFLLLTLALAAVFHVDCLAMAGNIYYGRGEWDKAAKILRTAVNRNTKSPAAHLHLAIYLLRRGGAAEAAVLLDKAMTLNPNAMTIKNIELTKGSALWVNGNPDAAIEHFERMRRRYDYVNAQVLSTLSYLYMLKGDIEQAETLSLAAVEDTPASSAAWDNLGQIYYRRKDFPQAKEAFKKALEHKPDLPDSLYFLGLMAKKEGDNAAAADYFDKALACEITPLNTITREEIQQAQK